MQCLLFYFFFIFFTTLIIKKHLFSKKKERNKIKTTTTTIHLLPKDVVVNNILNAYLSYQDLLAYSHTCKLFNKYSKQSCPNDIKTPIYDPLKWSICFPNASSICIKGNLWTDDTFKTLHNIKRLCMSGCNQSSITNNAFAWLNKDKLTYLDMRWCNQQEIASSILIPFK